MAHRPAVPPVPAPTLLHRTGDAPPDAVPLVRFADRYAVADLVTVLAGESRTTCPRACSPGRTAGCTDDHTDDHTAGYADDVAGAALALFEGVVDLVLAGTDVSSALVVFDGALRPAGVWTGPQTQRPLRLRPEQAVRLLVDAFSPFARGGEDALRVLADARAHVLTARSGISGAASRSASHDDDRHRAGTKG